MEIDNNSTPSHSVTHSSSHSYTDGWAVTESDFMTGTADHTCTGQCARIHLGAELRAFELGVALFRRRSPNDLQVRSPHGTLRVV